MCVFIYTNDNSKPFYSFILKYYKNYLYLPIYSEDLYKDHFNMFNMLSSTAPYYMNRRYLIRK